jgi:hypothetical protein
VIEHVRRGQRWRSAGYPSIRYSETPAAERMVTRAVRALTRGTILHPASEESAALAGDFESAGERLLVASSDLKLWYFMRVCRISPKPPTACTDFDSRRCK